MEGNIFETDRLIIRRLHATDIEGFYDMQSNPNVMLHVKQFMNREESEQELERFISYYSAEVTYFHIWAVVTKGDNTFVGICGVYENEQSEFEIAYRLRESCWGLGYGKEIAKGLVHHCFMHENLEELIAYVRSENLGSIKILEHEMTWVRDFYCEKARALEKIYHLKKEDWRKRQNAI